MLKIILIILGIILVLGLGLYLLIGFIMYGLVLYEMKEEDRKHKEYLGLSVAGMEYEADSDNSKEKLKMLFTLLYNGTFLVIQCIKEGNVKNMSKELIEDIKEIHGFSIW